MKQKKSLRKTLVAALIAGFAVATPAQAVKLTTPEIVASFLSWDCFDWQLKGICFWLKCGLSGCTVRTSLLVKHFLPDAVVSSYQNTGMNPWFEMSILSPPIPEVAEAGGHLITPSKKKDVLPRFKNVDVIGHPVDLWMVSQGLGMIDGLEEVFGEISDFVLGLEMICPGVGWPFMPYFLSTLDTVAWRWGVPEQVYPEALIPFMREVGSTFAGDMWGNVYPRQGFLVQVDDYKAAAVMAQRAADVVTREGQLHVYQPLTGSRSKGYWPPGPVVENDESTHKWQRLYPSMQMSCHIFPSSTVQESQGDYAWALWRPYECCRKKGQVLLYTVEF